MGMEMDGGCYEDLEKLGKDGGRQYSGRLIGGAFGVHLV